MFRAEEIRSAGGGAVISKVLTSAHETSFYRLSAECYSIESIGSVYKLTSIYPHVTWMTLDRFFFYFPALEMCIPCERISCGTISSCLVEADNYTARDHTNSVNLQLYNKNRPFIVTK